MGPFIPLLAQLLVTAPGYTLPKRDLRRAMRQRLNLSAADLVIDVSGIETWWHRVLSYVATPLRADGLLAEHSEIARDDWSLTATGVPWATQASGIAAPVAASAPTVVPAPPAQRPAYQHDERIRKAVEIRGVEVTEELYRGRGYSTTRRGKPYDLDALRAGGVRHVEVKGLQDEAPSEVIVTAGEVEHAREQEFPVDLVVVAGIAVAEINGTVIATGGNIYRHLENWIPATDALIPTQYRYRLPEAR